MVVFSPTYFATDHFEGAAITESTPNDDTYGAPKQVGDSLKSDVYIFWCM